MAQRARRGTPQRSAAPADPQWLSFFSCMTESGCGCEDDLPIGPPQPSQHRGTHGQYGSWGDSIRPIGARHVAPAALASPALAFTPPRATSPPAKLAGAYPPLFPPSSSPGTPQTLRRVPYPMSGLLRDARIEYHAPTTHQRYQGERSRMESEHAKLATFSPEHDKLATWEELEERLHALNLEHARLK
ncbi:hypothetical protein T484DRAFT_1793760 [Baffinella frigidus]|nr:hypothetical protein T484DRAFT_1793760 [Cryptophyta sp. CCMP2293]